MGWGPCPKGGGPHQQSWFMGPIPLRCIFWTLWVGAGALPFGLGPIPLRCIFWTPTQGVGAPSRFAGTPWGPIPLRGNPLGPHPASREPLGAPSRFAGTPTHPFFFSLHLFEPQPLPHILCSIAKITRGDIALHKSKWFLPEEGVCSQWCQSFYTVFLTSP